MRTISARKFRLAFPTLTEPVTVLLSKDGTFRELGTWTPAGTVEIAGDRLTWNSPMTVASVDFPRPVPKPSAKKR